MVRLPLDKTGDQLIISDGVSVRVEGLLGTWEEEGEGDGVEAVVRFETSDAGSTLLSSLFDDHGETPLPPYIRRAPRPEDRTRYQSVFANTLERAGSVAAPTAGLHFTRRLLGALESNGVATSRVALHVSAGTFKPVTAEILGEHSMHEERFTVSVDELESLAETMDANGPIVPVGTTAARVLESVYWLAYRSGLLLVDKSGRIPPSDTHSSSLPDVSESSSSLPFELGHLDQWAGSPSGRIVRHQEPLSASRVFGALAEAVRSRGHDAIGGSTSLCIAPGYDFRVCDGLLTNFHAPDSTLMMLVSAMVGGTESIHRVYEHAVKQRYRFLSYGDACFLFHHDRPNSAALSAAVAANARALQAGEAGGTSSSGGGGSDEGEAMVASMPSSSSSESVRKVLLHSCCAPILRRDGRGDGVRGPRRDDLLHNPNIHPKKEYEIRKDENKRYAEKLGIDFVDLDSDVDEWYRRAKGMEFCPERGARCTMCFDMRLERTALYAYENGFDSFTTTNATSRWKDEAQVNGSGIKAARKYPGVEYWLSDWQSEEMTSRKYRINASEAFYKQEYCGCSYSLRDSNHWRSKQGMPPIVIGDRGDSFYSDPEVDEQEESVEVVKSFFADSNAFEEELKTTYAARRKDSKGRGDESVNNW